MANIFSHYALPHLQPKGSSLQKALSFAENHAYKNDLPDIAVSAFQGQFLSLQCKLIHAKHVLEVGTLGGYSTIWLASSSSDIKITTIEVNEHHANVARDSIANAGLSDRVEVITGSGVDVVARLAAEVREGRREKFDFAFIDADKPNNWAYLREAIAMSRQAACLIVDNVVRRGTTANDELAKTDAAVKGSRLVIEEAGKDERLDATLLQMVGEKNYDGMLICVVK